MSCFVEKPGMVPFFNFSKTRDTRIGLMVNFRSESVLISQALNAIN